MDIIEIRNLVTVHSISDVQKGLYTERVVRNSPKNLLGYAGLESEDFIHYKEKFLAAAMDHNKLLLH